MNKPLRGAKGGGKGGSQQQRTPYEAPDNLLTDATAMVLDVVSEGEIEGWADPDYPAKCVYFDDTPLQNPDGTFNFSGVRFELRTGTPDQEPVPGFAAVENEVGVGVEVKQSQPVSRSITAEDVDAIRVKVGVSQLTFLNKDNGDLTGATVDFSIDLQAGNAGWNTIADLRLSGKTTSGYQRAYRVELPPVRPVTVRVRRRTPDQTVSNISDDLFFVSYTEIIDAKLSYPNTAYVALAVPAQAFGGRIPRRSYRLKGMKCWVPSNYDPVTRTYDETTIWDGTFKYVYSNNPAFFTYTVFLENRWGLGERIAPELVDKWRIYQIGKYCDENVPDGRGGVEPRFTMNGPMNTREAAYQVITQLSSAWRGVTYWGAGAVVPVQDAPADPVKLVTNANVVDGAFNYAGSDLSARKTAVVASLRDPEDHYRLKAGIVYEDHDAIQRYGRRQSDINLPYTTSRGEGLRAAKWLVDTDTTQRDTVTYQAGYDHAALRPGDRILIADKHRMGFRMGGRVLSITADRRSLTIDDPVTLQAAETYRLLLANDVGDFVEASLIAGQDGVVTDLAVTAPLPANIRPGTVFIMTASNLAPRLFRVLSNRPKKHLFGIIALEDDPNKFARIEQGIRVDDTAPYILPSLGRPSVTRALDVRTWFRASPTGLVATISWQSPITGAALSYRVAFTDADGQRRILPDTPMQSVDIALEGTQEGPYRVEVAAVNTATGVASDFVPKLFRLSADLIYPADVTGLRIKVIGDYAQLTWDAGGPSVAHYHVRHLATGSGDGWQQAVDVEVDVPGRSVTVPSLPGRFLVKAVSVFGTASRNAVSVENTSMSLQHFNVVKTITEAPHWPGLKSPGMAAVSGSLGLYSDAPIQTWSNLQDVRRIGFEGGAVSAGEYLVSEQVDLTDVYTSRLSAQLQAFGYLVDDAMAGWSSLSILDNLTRVDDDAWSVRLQVSVTSEDPSDPAATWSDWADFYVGDYVARGFRFRLLMNSNDPVVSIRINALSLLIDMPDRIEAGDDVECPPTGVYVAFLPPFRERPAIAVDGQELPSGARSIRTQVTREGFHQRFVDPSGTGVACSFDWVAKGYGRVQ
ncbi:host specificity protein J [Tateyamaria sp. syn59]|uniref:host specificity protein J n=1 Tax=Tateyamaria sp. syn59 TaxID=2576942 RepID=UPI00167B0F48|nr:phage tail protein [Tateyamaria sp. syn59]